MGVLPALAGRARRALCTLCATAPAPPPPVVSAAAAARAARGGAGVPRVTLVDVAGAEAFARAHARGARRLPIDAGTRDAERPRVVAPAVFDAVAAHLGLRAGVAAVVYDGGGAVAAARVWWTLRYYGVPASVLDGGWPAYVAADGPVATGAAADGGGGGGDAQPPVTAAPQRRLLATLDDVLGAAAAGAQLVDARTAAEFAGADLRGNRFGGRPPGAVHVPHAAVLGADGSFRPPDELRGLFAARGLDPARRVVAYCQAGARAAVVMAALERAGFPDVANYDGSMAEYNNVDGVPRDATPP